MPARLQPLLRSGIGPAIIIALGIAFLALSAVLVRADEQPIVLKQATGLAELTANCQGCHSLDYVRMNAPFITPDTWKAEITKMRAAYGAQIDDEDTGKILAYLSANYGPAN
jgi:mono/diheme cytochrome c family protein